VITPPELRAQFQRGDVSADQALLVVDEAIVSDPSASWWILRGDLIQLADATSYELSDAAESYIQAAELEPDNPEPLEELGHFFDAVMDEPKKARTFYIAALAKGAGQTCSSALEALDSDND
jgi:Tfp pilus assembly protein PilF